MTKPLLILALCLLFPSLLLAQATAPTSRPTSRPIDPALPTLWIIGDSTVHNSTPPLIGWGDVLGEFFDTSRINIVNRAVPGRSSRTFVYEGKWDAVLAQAKAGDFLLVQFGHNDAADPSPTNRGSLRGIGEETHDIVYPQTHKTETVHTFGWYLRKYVTDAKAKGMTPILCSWIPHCPRPGTTIPAGYPRTGFALYTAQVAEAEHADFIDLFAIINNFYQPLSPDQIKQLYFPTDFGHTNAAGAHVNATAVVVGIKRLPDNPLAQYLLPNPPTTMPAAPTPATTAP